MNNKIKKEKKLVSIVVVVSYLFKASAKLITGLTLSIPPLIADGLHGLIDIAEHCFLILGGQVARKQIREKYPIDRQPLLDLMGMLIFGGLIILGITWILQSIQLIINASVYFGWIDSFLTDWIVSQDNNELLKLKSIHLLIAAVIMLFSFVISEFVYRFEIRLGEHYPELRADAIELRSDGWLELGLGLSLLIAWILNILLKDVYDSIHLDAISTLVMGLITLGLGIYLFIIARPEFYESYKNLMNQAIKKDKRIRLEEEINKRLPERCDILSPLVGYHRGSQLFIKGYIQIDRNLMQSSDVIITNCEKLTKIFLSETGKEVHSQFSPLFNWSVETIKEDLNKVLHSIFEVDIDCPQSEAFRLMRFGKLESSIDLINSKYHSTKNEELLAIYVLSECNFQKFGPNDSKTINIVNQIKEQYLVEENQIYYALFLSWLLIYYTKLNGNSKQGQEIIVEFQKKIEPILEKNNLPDYMNAELCFALGFSWERRFDYDLEKCRHLYSKSEYYYSKSGIRSEVDRLMNTLGHLETLLYSLGDAEMHLNLAKDIREIKKDKLGLSYTYGSLGDLYVKMSRYEEADFYYTKDVELINELSIKHFIPSLNVKRGELHIRMGVLEKSSDKIKMGIKLCQDSEGSLSDPFFAKKGIVKGYLNLARLELNNKIKTEYLNTTNTYLLEMTPNNSYQEAFLYRLKGRYEGILGNYDAARQYLRQSGDNFNKLRDPIFNTANGIQEMVSSVEAFKWGKINEPIDLFNKKETPVQELQIFFQSIGGMLGKSKYMLAELVDNISTKKYKTKENFFRHIDILIWHLEG